MLTQDLEKLTRGKKNLENLLGTRKFKNKPIGLGYDEDKISNNNKDIQDVKNKQKEREKASTSKPKKQQIRYAKMYQS